MRLKTKTFICQGKNGNVSSTAMLKKFAPYSSENGWMTD